MILNWRNNVWMLAIVAVMACFQVASADAAVIELNDQAASVGDDVTFTVSLKDTPGEAFAFGFDILYDANVLTFSQNERGSLIQDGFAYFGGNELSSGRVRVGGAEVGETGIAKGNSGMLLTLTFKVIKAAVCNLSFTAIEDDFNGWSTRTGKFTPARPDVWVADPAPDNGSEPHSISRIWYSPAVWVRNQNDGVYQYQNVKYGQDNYVYVRVRNIGNLTAMDTTVEVYRINSSLGSGWPNGWSKVGTAAIDDLEPNASEDVVIRWDESEIPKPGHYCFYVRLLNDDDPMAVLEGNRPVTNTRNNNNIAWRNFNVVGLLNKVTDKFDVNVGNPEDQAVNVDIVFEDQDGLLNNDGARVIVDLKDLFQRWTDAGSGGENIRILDGTEVQLTGTSAKFFGISMEANEVQTITMRADAFKPMPVPGTSKEYRFSAQEFINDELIGGVDYIITTRALGTDTDGDGDPDVTDPDDDGDEIPDDKEIENELNPLVHDANEDPDEDGRTNIREVLTDGTDPFVAEVKDCNGVWNGTALVDGCGQCVGGNTGKTACPQDCNGDAGGTAFADECDECVGGNTGKVACEKDCNGDAGGTAFTDECDECVGGNTGKVACEKDCNGDAGGTAFTDECDACVGGNTGKTACPKDCNGDFGGTATLDSCGDCVGGNTGKDACVEDCNGESGGTAYLDDCDECVGGSTGKEPCSSPYSGGTFVVGEECGGIVKVDWLYDGGMYKGELGIFSMSGMEKFTPGSKEFIAEAVRRVLSDPEEKEGGIALSDPTEKARYSGLLGESTDWNSGTYMGARELEMVPGDRFATILVPNGTFQSLSRNPGTTSSYLRPLFSLVSSNPAYGMYLGQIADVNGLGTAFSYEDINAANSDKDYNDLIIRILCATVEDVPTLDFMVAEGGVITKAARSKRGRDDRWFDWRTETDLGRLIILHLETEPEAVQMIVELDASADMLVYDPEGREIGRDGGSIPGASFTRSADGNQLVTLPALDDGVYRMVIRGTEDETGLLTVKKVMEDGRILSEAMREADIRAHQPVKSDIAVSPSADDAEVDVSEIGESPAGFGDLNGDDVVDHQDIKMVSSRWNVCEGSDEYDRFFDFDKDGCITILDIMRIVNSR